MSGPIIRTVWLTDECMARMRDGRSFSTWKDDRAATHPVLVTHAPDMPNFLAGDRVRHHQSGEEVGVDGVYLDEGGTWCFVGCDVDVRAAAGWSRVESESESDPRATLVDALRDWRDAGGSTSHVVAALDDYISRTLGRERSCDPWNEPGVSLTNVESREGAQAREIERLRERLRKIASVAHAGGAVSMSEEDVVVAVRRMTIPHWDGIAKPEHVLRAIDRPTHPTEEASHE